MKSNAGVQPISLLAIRAAQNQGHGHRYKVQKDSDRSFLESYAAFTQNSLKVMRAQLNLKLPHIGLGQQISLKVIIAWSLHHLISCISRPSFVA